MPDTTEEGPVLTRCDLTITWIDDSYQEYEDYDDDDNPIGEGYLVNDSYYTVRWSDPNGSPTSWSNYEMYYNDQQFTRKSAAEAFLRDYYPATRRWRVARGYA